MGATMNQISLTDAVRILFFEASHHQQKSTAAERIHRELLASAEKSSLQSFEKSLGKGAVLDAVQSVVIKAMLREKPVTLSKPPSTEASARAYLRRAVRNYLIDRLKEKERAGEEELNDHIGYQICEAPEHGEATDDASSGRFDSTGFQWLEPEHAEPKEIISQILDKLDCYSASLNQEERLSDIDYETQKNSLEIFRKSVIETCDQLRSRQNQVRFATAFQRIVRCALKQTTMEAEVDKIVESQGGDRKKIRNTLDQQNSRTLSRIYESLVENGIPVDQARHIVSRLAVRGLRRLSPEGPK
jgi:DNA-directed RNA polymerase specialized sigma24 family protein